MNQNNQELQTPSQDIIFISILYKLSKWDMLHSNPASNTFN